MIELEGIQREFVVGDQLVYALQDVTLRVERGEYVSLMGPSGSGKSTLLNIIGLLDRPSGGSYRLNGEDVTRLQDRSRASIRRQKIGFIFQLFHLIPRLTAKENIELPLILSGMSALERSRRVERALSAFGLTDRANHRPNQLSGGQCQRVAIARAAITEPEILLADEPTGNLDRASGREIIELLETLNQQGIMLLLVTHDPQLALRAARTLRMLDGRIMAPAG